MFRYILIMIAMATAVSQADIPIANRVKKKHIPAGHEPVDSGEKHDRADHQIIFHRYFHTIQFSCLTFPGDQDTPDNTSQQQNTDYLER